jgi:hypothetical protein
MNDTKKSETDTQDSAMVRTVLSNLGAVFRHLFPGVLIIGVAYITHPYWFCRLNTYSWQHLMLAGVVALVAGNIWYTLNRYVWHQAVDFGMYRFGIPGPGRAGHGYHQDLANFVAASISSADIPKRARQHIEFRSSSVLFIYMIGEIGLVLSFRPGQSAWIAANVWPLGIASALVLVGGLWQHCITRMIDNQIVARAQEDTRANVSDARS